MAIERLVEPTAAENNKDEEKDKEKFVAQFKRLFYSVLPNDKANNTIAFFRNQMNLKNQKNSAL